MWVGEDRRRGGEPAKVGWLVGPRRSGKRWKGKVEKMLSAVVRCLSVFHAGEEVAMRREWKEWRW